MERFKDIILLTKHFPYNRGETPGETFLETEIAVLAQKADRVFVFAADVKRGTSVSCKCPENVYPTAMQSVSSSHVQLASFLRGLWFSPSSAPEFRLESENCDFKNRLYMNYFIERGKQKYKCILNELEAKCISFRERYVLIYSYWFYDFAYAAVLLREYLRPKCASIRSISRAHRYDLYEYTHKGSYIPLRPFLLGSLDHVFPCSKNGTEYLCSKYPEYREKISLSYVGTPDHGVYPWRGDENMIRLVSCSRLAAVKRVERIAESLSLLRDMQIPLKWIHLGGGGSLETLQKTCNEKLPAGSVELMGNLPNSKVLDFYERVPVSIFLNVSENEGIPASIMEAISFGIPVIATEVGGTAEIVRDGVNGILLRKDFTNEELAQAILRILSMVQEEYLQMRINARLIWEESFVFWKNTENMLEQAWEERANVQSNPNENENVPTVATHP